MIWGYTSTPTDGLQIRVESLSVIPTIHHGGVYGVVVETVDLDPRNILDSRIYTRKWSRGQLWSTVDIFVLVFGDALAN